MIVVFDTSPILNLARIGRLDLLRLLYRQVIIPGAVYAELTDQKRDPPPAIDLASMSWLPVAPVAGLDKVRALRENLDAGEAEAIVLAFERTYCLWTKDAAVGLRPRPHRDPV